jgi:hypothetical protein
LPSFVLSHKFEWESRLLFSLLHTPNSLQRDTRNFLKVVSGTLWTQFTETSKSLYWKQN